LTGVCQVFRVGSTTLEDWIEASAEAQKVGFITREYGYTLDLFGQLSDFHANF
jgi:hypothetical protein